jgi:putative ABC transport system permease protein
MGVLWDKIWSDLWDNKGRTLQVVLIIAMGAFAIGMIIGTRNYIIGGMEEIWRQSSPAMINLWVHPSVDDDALMALEHVEGVAGVEGFMQTTLEWRLSPDDRWSPGGLTARDDYENQRFAKLSPISGNWPRKKVFAVGQGADTRFDIQQGSQVYIRIDDREYVVEAGGVIYDPNVQPPNFGGNAQFYTTHDRFGDLTGERGFNRILAGASRWDEALVTAIADEMQEKLEKQDVDSGGFAPPNGDRVSDPDKHFFQDTMDGIFFILGVMAILALILGLFLVYNTVTAMISRQINQIGILKAIGARTRLILYVYLVNVFIYGFLALVIALPLGVIGARALGTFLLDAFNADGSFTISPSAILAQVAIALLSPLLACLVPIFTGARITVREAISTYGLSASSSPLDRLLAKIQRIPQLVSLTLSNTFRHKQRVLLTQITLVLSGVIFMTVMSARDTAVYTFDDLVTSILRFNINFQFRDPERIDRVEAMTVSQPGVKAVEMWSLSSAAIRLAGQPESKDDESALLLGVPLPTALYSPQMRAGRWLQPGDTYAVVLNQKLAEDAGVSLGDTVTFDHGFNGESDWLVVGLLFDPALSNSAHVPRDVLLKEVHSVNKASTIWIQTERDDAASEVAIARELREYYKQNQLKLNAGSVFGQDTASEIVGTVIGQFAIIVTLLATMAVVIGMVGSIALSGVLSLNVLERRREIGVLRAIGASSGVVAGLLIGEGVILGWLSWLVALPLSIPAGKLMAQGLGAAVDLELVYKYTPTGALYWLAVITLLSVAASWLPARGATRISVRESLAYE